MTDTFHCTVVTPERQVLDTDAIFVALPAHDGEIGILRDRAPLVCKLGIGILRLKSDGAATQLYIDGGFAQVRDNDVTVLTARALTPQQIDPQAAAAALAQAAAVHPTDRAGQHARHIAMQRARCQLKLSRAPQR